MKKLVLSLVALAAFNFSASAQWTQLGNAMVGEAAGDISGTSVSLSNDGTIIAIGAPQNDGSADNAGQVRVYENIGGTWTQLGDDIDGESIAIQSGTSVSVSNDGLTVAIGAPRFSNYTGFVRVYTLTGGAWVQQGIDIDGEADYDEFGGAISLSGDGTTLAIGAKTNDANGANSGEVKIFKYQTGAWVQQGIDIAGDNSYDQFGTAVSLNDDGTIVIIGAPTNDAAAPDAGCVKVYEYTTGAWVQLGTNINGEATANNLGSAVSISSDGLTIAVGAPNHSSGYGQIKVYKNIGGTWTQQGSAIAGQSSNDYAGTSLSLNDDGTMLALGVNGMTNAGHVRVYEFTTGNWNQVGTDINGGAATADFFGGSVSLSGDGSIVAGGAIGFDGNGNSSGRTVVYENAAITVGLQAVNHQVAVNIYPNPLSEQLKIVSDETIESITLYDITGKTARIFSGQTTTMDLSDLQAGVYLLQVQGAKGVATKRLIKE